PPRVRRAPQDGQELTALGGGSGAFALLEHLARRGARGSPGHREAHPEGDRSPSGFGRRPEERGDSRRAKHSTWDGEKSHGEHPEEAKSSLPAAGAPVRPATGRGRDLLEGVLCPVVGLNARAGCARLGQICFVYMHASFSRWVRNCSPANLEQITHEKMKHLDDGLTTVAC